MVLSWGFILTEEGVEIFNISILKISWAYILSTNFSNSSCISIFQSSLFLAICPLPTKIQALLVLLLYNKSIHIDVFRYQILFMINKWEIYRKTNNFSENNHKNWKFKMYEIHIVYDSTYPVFL